MHCHFFFRFVGIRVRLASEFEESGCSQDYLTGSESEREKYLRRFFMLYRSVDLCLFQTSLFPMTEFLFKYLKVYLLMHKARSFQTISYDLFCGPEV